MENDGVEARVGSHFERRQFVFEAMVSLVIYEQNYSQFALALLEGSSWYVPDYSYVDPYFFGQGQGCNFLKGTCQNSGAVYEEFCVGSRRGCSFPGRGGGRCSYDIKSDGFRYQFPDVNYDYENTNATNNLRLSSLQVFGRGLGSKCFSGNLTTAKTDAATSFCFTYNCQGSGLNTALTVKVGSLNVTCNAEEPVKVTGYNGKIDCPDPLTFCSTIGQSYCPRNCMGRGTCMKKKSVCNTGFVGVDCALNSNEIYA